MKGIKENVRKNTRQKLRNKHHYKIKQNNTKTVINQNVE